MELIDPTAKNTIRMLERKTPNSYTMIFGQPRKAGEVVPDVPSIDALNLVHRGLAVIVS